MMAPSVEGATVRGVDADLDADVSLEVVVELLITIELPSAMMCAMEDADATGTTQKACTNGAKPMKKAPITRARTLFLTA